jgi:chromate transporter
MKELWQLFIVFCRIGGFTFGGGYSMLPIIQKEMVEKKKWASDHEILDYYAIGQCTPGLIAVNTATFIGYKRKGIIGAIVATLGVVFPSFVIITIIAAYFRYFRDLKAVKNAFAGIRVAVAVLIINAVARMWKNSIKDRLGVIVFVASFAVAVFTKISPVIIIAISAAAGIIINRRRIGGK